MSDQLDRIIDLSFALHRVIRRHASDYIGERKSGVSLVHLQALVFIAEHDTVTMTQLAKWLMITPSSTTSFAARLHRLGFVERVSDPKNRKLVRLKLTARGSTYIGHAMEMHRKELKALMSTLPENVQTRFAESLSEVIKNFSATA